METRKVGVLGAGQLGRMFVEAASRLNVEVHLLDVGNTAPAKQILASSHHIDGAFNDAEKIWELAKSVDILTVEIEHVNADALRSVLDEGLVKEVHPTPNTIQLIQDKYKQKKFLVAGKVPVADFVSVGPESELGDPSLAKKLQVQGILEAGKQFGYPLMVKSRTQAYDGKGNFVVKSETDAERAVESLGDGSRGLYAERWTEFEKEVAVMVVRSSSGEVRAYPTVETYHENSICHSVFAPLRHEKTFVAYQAQEIAKRSVAMLEGAGVFGVEMFLMKDGDLLINEIAPRPHNSGHYTIEACETSQYENHVRAILGLPLGSTDLKVGSAAMINILGLADLDKDPEAVEKTMAPAVTSLGVPGATVHLYGKVGCRKGRKMGHITVVGKNDAQVRQRYQVILDSLNAATRAADEQEKLDKALSKVGAAAAAAFASSSKLLSSSSSEYTAADFSHPHPLIGIVMGSDSDLPVMLPAAHILKRFNIPFELTIVSAHRTPDRMTRYARQASSRGLRVVIAGAGGAAHLPGMIAAQSPLPIIGVPVKGSTLDGVDSLHSIVQMPRGIPVATVAINNSTNAALLAARIVASADAELLKSMQEYMDEMEAEVMGKVDRLQSQGWHYVVKK
jgi:phosphoribosylaminoimidazole carboxylase